MHTAIYTILVFLVLCVTQVPASNHFKSSQDEDKASASSVGSILAQPVKHLDLQKYSGRWYQVYGSPASDLLSGNFAGKLNCVTADYTPLKNGSVAVLNAGVDSKGKLHLLPGIGKQPNPDVGGALYVKLYGVPFGYAPDWTLALGPDTFEKDGQKYYEWTIVSDPFRAILFVLVRDPQNYIIFDLVIKSKLKELGFSHFFNSPTRIRQDEQCTYTPIPKYPETDSVPLIASRYEMNDYKGILADPVAELDVEKYSGRWYQVYGSVGSDIIDGNKHGKLNCVTADYTPLANGSIAILNAGMDSKGSIQSLAGLGTQPDPHRGGALWVKLYGVPFGAQPDWVLALGPDAYEKDGKKFYSWSIVSDPLRLLLFVLVRDLEDLVTYELSIKARLYEIGFKHFYNRPTVIRHDASCKYVDVPTYPEAKESSLFNIIQ